MVGSTLHDEWSYTDLLADRLQVMMPVLPGLIVSLLPDSSRGNPPEDIPSKSVIVLSGILTAVGGAFHRVFGGVIHSAGGQRGKFRKQSDTASATIKAAKTYVPHLLTVTTILDETMRERELVGSVDRGVDILPPHSKASGNRRLADSDSWADVSSTIETFVNEHVVSPPTDQSHLDTETTVSILRSCQQSAMNSAAGLISNAMSLGGAGTTTSLWQSVLLALREFVTSEHPDSHVVEEKTAPESGEDSLFLNNVGRNSDAGLLARGILCQLIALVLRKTLNRDGRWGTWNYEMSSAVSTTCVLVEEKKLLAGAPGPTEHTQHCADQVVLLCVLTDVLAFGRESTGWCQLALPSMPASNTLSDGEGTASMEATSRLLLPVLLPCLRVVLESLPGIDTSTIVRVPNDVGEEGEALLGKILSELDHSLTAAVVGLSFASARDVALTAMATLRKTSKQRRENGDDDGAQLCSGLLCKVVEELGARYESERRLRENALCDAYEDDAKQEAAAGSQAVERLILGGDILGSSSADSGTEEVSFHGDTLSKNSKKVSDDFVLFSRLQKRTEAQCQRCLGSTNIKVSGRHWKESKERNLIPLLTKPLVC